VDDLPGKSSEQVRKVEVEDIIDDGVARKFEKEGAF